MARHEVSARLESHNIPASALSRILVTSEQNGWDADVTYAVGRGTTVAFDVDLETIDEVATTLREMIDTVEKSELNAR